MLFSTGTAKNVISSTEKKLFRKKRKRTREWREVEEALSFVIVPGNVVWNEHRRIPFGYKC
jgi:hypothetical protein